VAAISAAAAALAGGEETDAGGTQHKATV